MLLTHHREVTLLYRQLIVHLFPIYIHCSRDLTRGQGGHLSTLISFCSPELVLTDEVVLSQQLYSTVS